MKFRKKTTATLMIAIFMISTFAVMVSAGAQNGWGKPEVLVRSAGQFTSTYSTGVSGYPSTEGHRCIIAVHAERVLGEWIGEGVFMDKDYGLRAILTVDGATEYLWNNQVILEGDAEIFINGEYVDVYRFYATVIDGESFNYANIQILTLKYFSWDYGSDKLANTVVKIIPNGK